jgi:hypothetical protein
MDNSSYLRRIVVGFFKRLMQNDEEVDFQGSEDAEESYELKFARALRLERNK